MPYGKYSLTFNTLLLYPGRKLMFILAVDALAERNYLLR